MKTIIEKLDLLGNGICYINNKICFVPKCIPNDEVDIDIIYENKDYAKGKVNKVIKPSLDRKESFCPYFKDCGGCHLQYLSYDKTLDYKKERVESILKKVIDIPNINIIENIKKTNYRNKIELKIQDYKIGFYEKESHKLVPINFCQVTKECINNFLKEIKLMNIKNGFVTIRCNYNNELLINIETKDNIILTKDNYPSYKVVGIILNNKTVYGENHFIDIIDNYYFDVSYDAFFQVNSYINTQLFNIIKDNTKDGIILDLYSGVGTLGIVASKKAKKVYSIECIPNAVLNGIKNAKINNCQNIDFMLGNVEEKIDFIKDKVDTVIVDPPRKGLDKHTTNKIQELKPEKIIYISCDTNSLANNLKDLKNDYLIDKLYILDMFSYSYHTEVLSILKLK